MTTMIRVENVTKAFTLHNQGGVRLPVFDDLSVHRSPSHWAMFSARRPPTRSCTR